MVGILYTLIQVSHAIEVMAGVLGIYGLITAVGAGQIGCGVIFLKWQVVEVRFVLVRFEL